MRSTEATANSGGLTRISKVQPDRDAHVRAMPFFRRCLSLLTPTGLVTDYGSSMVQWMRTRQPRYKGSHRLETERPSASFAVDVCVA
jgi:hypothetical protein